MIFNLAELMLILGNESISKVGDKEYYNAPLDRECIYYAFIRAYANNHNTSVRTWLLCDVICVCYRTQGTHQAACLSQLVSSLHIKTVGVSEFVVFVPSGPGKLYCIGCCMVVLFHQLF